MNAPARGPARGMPLVDPPTGPPVAGPTSGAPTGSSAGGRRRNTRRALGLVVAAVGATALITWATSPDDDVASDVTIDVDESEPRATSDGDDREQLADDEIAPAVTAPPATAAAPVESAPPTAASPPATAPDPTSAPSPTTTPDDEPGAGAFDTDASSDTDLDDLQAGVDKLEDADDSDVLVLSLPAGAPADPGGLQPLTATIRGDQVFLEGTAPSSDVGRDYELQARGIWGDQVVARYSIDARAPAPLADDVVLEKPVLFEPGSTKIDPEYLPVLDACFEFLTAYPSVIMIVEGHTDDVGSDEYNLRLAQQRADAIVAYYESLGLAPDRLVTVAAGESDPLADNDTDDGREQNRRIDLSLVGALIAAGDDGEPDTEPTADNGDGDGTGDDN